MTMYMELLDRSLESWDDQMADDPLLEHVLTLRAALPLHRFGAGARSEETLAAEVAYDRAIINLAARHGIDVAPVRFAHPKIERKRLESELAEVGIDLEVQAPTTRATSSASPSS